MDLKCIGIENIKYQYNLTYVQNLYARQMNELNALKKSSKQMCIFKTVMKHNVPWMH